MNNNTDFYRAVSEGDSPRRPPRSTAAVPAGLAGRDRGRRHRQGGRARARSAAEPLPRRLKSTRAEPRELPVSPIVGPGVLRRGTLEVSRDAGGEEHAMDPKTHARRRPRTTSSSRPIPADASSGSPCSCPGRPLRRGHADASPTRAVDHVARRRLRGGPGVAGRCCSRGSRSASPCAAQRPDPPRRPGRHFDLEDPAVDIRVNDGEIAFAHYMDRWVVVAPGTSTGRSSATWSCTTRTRPTATPRSGTGASTAESRRRLLKKVRTGRNLPGSAGDYLSGCPRTRHGCSDLGR